MLNLFTSAQHYRLNIRSRLQVVNRSHEQDTFPRAENSVVDVVNVEVAIRPDIRVMRFLPEVVFGLKFYDTESNGS